MGRAAYLLSIILLLTACGKWSSPASSDADLPQKVMPDAADESRCNRYYEKNARGKRISWKGAVPVVFNLDPAFPKEFVPALESAMKSWNEAAGRPVFALAGFRTGTSVPASDGQNTIYYASNNAQGKALLAIIKANRRDRGGDAIAMTLGEFSGNKLFGADIIFDGTTHSFSTSRIHLYSFDVEAVALHELGHALGLQHHEDPASVMYYGSSPVSVSLRFIDDTSVKLLACEY
jgi:hypothetical protein